MIYLQSGNRFRIRVIPLVVNENTCVTVRNSEYEFLSIRFFFSFFFLINNNFAYLCISQLRLLKNKKQQQPYSKQNPKNKHPFRYCICSN